MPQTKLQSINPKNNEVIAEYDYHDAKQVKEKLALADDKFNEWKHVSIAERSKLMLKVADILRSKKVEYGNLISFEMGKLQSEAEAEIEKCAWLCEYYAENAQEFLKDEIIETDAKKSLVTFQPLGAILAIMPWNFPFWQVMRFAVPNLLAGNVGVLKHASNVSGCALAIEDIFKQAGFEAGCFTSLLVGSDKVADIVANPIIKAVTLTGSTPAGKSVAKTAGENLKKTVLELGGSDPYVVLKDANLDLAAKICAKSRLQNAGQSCIAAKRFIVEKQVYDEFCEKLHQHFLEASIAPMARVDLAKELEEQVKKSVSKGAKLLLGGNRDDAYFEPTILVDVKPNMPAFDEELFGPVAPVIKAETEDEAFELANKTVFGLGSAIFTSDEERGLELAKTKIQAGACFVNAMVASDPRLPFGGIGESGYGRELGLFGIREFVNIKTVSVG